MNNTKKQSKGDKMLLKLLGSHTASKSMTPANLKKALKQGANINLQHPITKHTALYKSILEKNAAAVKFLLSKGADVSLLDKDDRNVCHAAAGIGMASLLPELIEAKADVTALDRAQRGTLWLAAAEGQVEAVKALLALELPVDAVGQEGVTALSIAANKGHLECVTALLEAKANVHTQNAKGVSAFYGASIGGFHDIMTVLMKAGADINVAERVHGKRPLDVAAEKGHLKAVQQLLNANADVNYLTTAAQQTALFGAAQYGHVDVLKVLIDAKANVSVVAQKGRTALHGACAGGHAKAVAILLEAGAETETEMKLDKKNHATPLVLAATMGRLDTVSLLIQAGANVNVTQNDDNITLLHVTAESGLLTTLQALLEAKADVTAITKNGQTPLYTAATNGEVACVVALLEAKADVNTPRNDGTTPLHAAALVGKTAVVAALLEHKANPLLKTNKTKKIALQYALLNKDNKPAADLLKPVSGKHCNTCGFSDSQVVQDGEKQLTSCGTCLAVDYCSRPCQVKDWKAGHKKQCKRLKAKRENALLHDQISADIDMD